MKGRFVPPSIRRRRRGIILKMTAFILIIAVGAVAIDRKFLYPLVVSYAQAQAQILANNMINEAVSEYFESANIEYDDLVKLNQNTDNTVKSMSANTVEINKIKVEVIARVREKINGSDETTIGIPLGSLTGSSYLTGRGPVIKIRLKMASNITAAFESGFSGAGINQTLHTINLKVNANVFIVMPYSRCSTEFTTDYLVAQTVIAGGVPDAYTFVNELGGDTDRLIMDYGAK